MYESILNWHLLKRHTRISQGLNLSTSICNLLTVFFRLLIIFRSGSIRTLQLSMCDVRDDLESARNQKINNHASSVKISNSICNLLNFLFVFSLFSLQDSRIAIFKLRCVSRSRPEHGFKRQTLSSAEVTSKLICSLLQVSLVVRLFAVRMLVLPLFFLVLIDTCIKSEPANFQGTNQKFSRFESSKSICNVLNVFLSFDDFPGQDRLTRCNFQRAMCESTLDRHEIKRQTIIPIELTSRS